MTNIKVEEFLGNEIRFVEVNNEWKAVGTDVAKALGYTDLNQAIKKHVDEEDTETLTYKASVEMTYSNLWGTNDYSNKKVINNYGIYSLIFGSKLESAKQFKYWVFDIIETLRESANVTAFELLRKENQKLVTDKLRDGLENAEPKHYRKAHMVANKAVSNNYGFAKKLDLGEMPPEMQVDREPIFNDTVELMVMQEKMGLDISISKTIYAKHCK